MRTGRSLRPAVGLAQLRRLDRLTCGCIVGQPLGAATARQHGAQCCNAHQPPLRLLLLDGSQQAGWHELDSGCDGSAAAACWPTGSNAGNGVEQVAGQSSSAGVVKHDCGWQLQPHARAQGVAQLHGACGTGSSH